MKKIFIILLMALPLKVSAQTICEGQQVVPQTTFNQCNNDPYWVLVFEDDFNEDSLDLSKWEIQGWSQGALYGNNGKSQEYNSLDNAVVSDGILKIIAKKETVERRAVSWKPDDEILEDGLPNLRTYNYTSSNIWSKSMFSYGKFEARIKIPKGKGFWPAFWIYAGNPWREIDIFEFWNEIDASHNYDPSKLSKIHHMTVHYDYDNDGSDKLCETHYTGVDFSQSFHTYTLIWEKNKIEWYIDGQLKRTDYKYYTILGQITGCTINAGMPYMMNKIYPTDSMAIILNLAIQTGLDKYANNRSPDNTTPFPSQMEVDWVKYYQRKPYQDFYITGAPTICSINSSYTLNNRPPNSTLFWTNSSNLSYISGQGTTEYTVKEKNIIGSKTEQGWVEVSVNGIKRRKYIKLSRFPSSPTIHVPIEPVNCQYNAMFWASDSPDDLSYFWEIQNGTIISQNNEEVVVKPNCPPDHKVKPSYLYLTVATSNECGSSSSSRNVQISNDGIINPLNVTIYPNPTKGVLTISIDSQNNNSISFKENEIFIFNRNMNLVLYKKVTANDFKLDLMKLHPDIYFLKIVKSNKSYIQTIILK